MARELHAAAIRCATIIHNLTIVVTPSLPIGLAYIVAAIKDLVSLETIDAIAERPDITEVTPFDEDLSILGLSPAETVSRIQRAPDICLISSMFSTEWPLTRELIDRIRDAYPECVIVGGGEHFTAAAEYSLRHSGLDICVLGEGEATARDLVQRMVAGEVMPLDVPGTVAKDRTTGEIIRNPPRQRIRDLHEVRHPAWEMFDVEAFLDRGLGQFDGGREHVRAMPFVASRGCPYRCTFCSNEAMWGTRWTPRPAQDVIDEWKLLMERYGANHFDSCDLTAIVKRDWIIEFTKLLIRENLGVTWGMPSGTRSEVLDEETLTLLKQSGCQDITYAPESGSEHILQAMKKRASKKKMLASMRACHKVGIAAKANIILGHPDEQRRHILETYGFILQMATAGIEDLMVTEICPYPGTKVFADLVQAGEITMDERYFRNLSFMTSLGTSASYAHYTRLELQLFRLGAWSMFYAYSHVIRPRRLATLAADLWRGHGSTRFSKGLLNLARRRRKLRTADRLSPARLQQLPIVNTPSSPT